MKGWVIEVLGYTYHKHGEKLIEHTLLENLKYPDRLEGSGADGRDDETSQGSCRLRAACWANTKNPTPGQFKDYLAQHLEDAGQGRASPGTAGAGGEGRGKGRSRRR